MDYTDIIIYAAVTAFLAYRLWTVLGRRDADEPERPPRRNPFQQNENQEHDDEDVVVLSDRARAAAQAPSLVLSGPAPASLAGALDLVRAKDPTFEEKRFLEGAKMAFSAIVAAFAAGDLSPVARFLGPAVRNPFQAAIDARRSASQTLENKIERLAAVDIIAAKLDGVLARLTVEFVSHQVNVLRDAEGKILDGVPGQAEEVRDLWVFERDLSSANPNWLLVETRS